MRAVLMDVDGTMIDSYPGVVASYLAALEQVGASHPEAKPLRQVLGPPMVESFAEAGVVGADIEKARQAYMDAYRADGWTNASAYEGVGDFLQAMKDQQVVLATATSKGDFFTRKVLERAGLLDFFDVVATAGIPGVREFPTKADVVGDAVAQVRAVAAARGLDADEPIDFVMVGDRHHDISGAKTHGIDTVAATWGYGDEAEWAMARARAKDFSELGRVIDGLW
ncbi:HAD hydrolase-like protein [Corynebacterium aquilae]|uniref:HAD family hydrolase n=1 Tax=Corynebacterium aquilae DSM 44791 TaxID=1431546 RepID=A0A1L7CH41_9CORY|nr:HAD hydrolase-like protein [Corynebacterium aquilae]APT85156.1 hypothetical protein CAQU_08810 [Corynebacterium aquilae DSM 44791]